MSESRHPTEPDSELPTQVDPDRLSKLLEQAISLKESGDAAFVNTVLNQVDESVRQDYMQALLMRLQAFGDQSLQLSNNATLEPQGNFPRLREPLPTVDDRRAKRSKNDTQRPLPERIGKFRIERELGRGACGAVYLGFDDELQRHVAVKVALVADHREEQLRLEAAKLAQVESTGIVPVYHIGKTEQGEIYIVEKYIRGTTLRHYLRKGPLSPALAARLALQLALSLEPAHLQQILHRDLKPENILIEKNGRPWIADFGLAISEDEQVGKRQLAGTPHYMSPEQIDGRVDFMDPRSDIWALGVMYYEMLTGKLPFTGADRKSLREQICHRDPRPLQQRAPGHLTQPMNAIFQKCCAKKPADRYATVHELAIDLEVLIAEGLSEQNIHGETKAGQGGIQTTVGTHSGSMSTRAGLNTLATTHHEHDVDHKSHHWIATLAISVAMLLALMIVVHQLYWKPELPSPPGPDGPKFVPAPVVLDQWDGSETKPWHVDRNGKGSHQTIAKAIAAGPPGAFIRVTPDTYEEALVITAPVTIFPTRVTSEESYPCEIRSSDGPPITIDCPDQSVTVRGFSIHGLGRHSTEAGEFNAIDLLGGKLILKSCEVQTTSYTCVKIRNGACLETTGCEFPSSTDWSISAVGSHVEARDCEFYGVQIDAGTATLDDCQMYGKYGLYVSNDAIVEAVDCALTDNRDYGIAAANGGQVLAKHVTVTGSGDSVGVQSFSGGRDDPEAKPGSITLQGKSTIENCGRAALVQNGILKSDSVKIDNCRHGIWAEGGEVTLRDTEILFTSEVAVQLFDDAVVNLAECQINESHIGISAFSGTLAFDGGRISDCTSTGIAFGDKENRLASADSTGSLSNVSISVKDNATGVMVESGSLILENIRLSGGDYGIVAQGPVTSRPNRKPLARIYATGLRCDGQEKFVAVASGDARIELDKDTWEALVGSTRQAEGGRIVETGGETASESESESVSDSRFIRQ